MGELVELQVVGLREFTSRLKAIDSDLPKALRIAFNDAANIVVQDAKPRVPTLTGAAKGSVKAASTRTAARVKGGGGKAPYYPWLDFGGSVGRDRSVQRPFLTHGRYIYNAYFSNHAKFVDAMSDAITTVARQAGIEVTGGG